MKIILCLKQVPENNIKMDWDKGKLIRESSNNALNPDDYHAIEFALNLKERFGGNITAITMGPPQAEEVLREAYSFGINKAILITDPRFAGSDTLVTSKILNRAIEKMGKFDIIVTGKRSADGDTGHVSYQLSEYFQIPHITQIHTFKLEGDKNAIVERIFGHEFQKVRTPLPIVAAIEKKANDVRFPKLVNIKKSFDKEIQIMNMDDIGGSEDEYGLLGSPTITLNGELFRHERKNEVFEGTMTQKIDQLISKLKKYNMLGN